MAKQLVQTNYLALNLKRLRQKRKMTQAELAWVSGCTSVGMIEAGKRLSPRADSLADLADALGVSVSALFRVPRK